MWLLQIGESLPVLPGIRKLRTALLSEKLIEKGHEVTWWASAYDHFQKKWVYPKDTNLQLENGLNIRTIKGTGYKKNVSVMRWIDHRLIARKFKRKAQASLPPDLIVASMPSYDLAYEAVKYGQKLGIPVVIDIRDQWPDIFLEALPHSLNKFGRLLLRNEFALLEKTLKGSDAILSMMNVLLDWGLDYAERSRTWKDKVFYLGYKKKKNGNPPQSKITELKKKLSGSFVVTFIGTFGSYHDPSILIDAAQMLKNDNIAFVLAGDGEKFKNIKNSAKQLPNVHLTGWLNQAEIDSLLTYSQLGVCTCTKAANFFPNKSFLYLSNGLPVISAFQGDLKNYLENEKIGFYYPPNDVVALVKCIKLLSEDKTLYEGFSQRAANVFNQHFESDLIYQNYAGHLEDIAHRYLEMSSYSTAP